MSIGERQISQRRGSKSLWKIKKRYIRENDHLQETKNEQEAELKTAMDELKKNQNIIKKKRIASIFGG